MLKFIKKYLIPKCITTPQCQHEEWVQDIQIRVLECKQCGKRAWLKETIDLFKK